MFVLLANLSEVCYAFLILFGFEFAQRDWFPLILFQPCLPASIKQEAIVAIQIIPPQCTAQCTLYIALHCPLNCSAMHCAVQRCVKVCYAYVSVQFYVSVQTTFTVHKIVHWTTKCWSLPCLCVSPLSVLSSTLNCSQRDDCHSTTFVSVFPLHFICISSVICICIVSTLNCSTRYIITYIIPCSISWPSRCSRFQSRASWNWFWICFSFVFLSPFVIVFGSLLLHCCILLSVFAFNTYHSSALSFGHPDALRF